MDVDNFKISVYFMFQIFFSQFFFCKNKLSPLVSAVLIAVAIVFGTGTNIAFIFIKVTFVVYR